MSPLVPDARLGSARRSFFERGTAPVGAVPSTILQSWQRCQRHGLAVDEQPELGPLPDGRLRELRQRRERLWRLARPELDGLGGELAANGSIVLLTDEDGWILDAEGSTGFLDKAGRVALLPGARWDEGTVGTNAIGTALVEGRAVQVRGGEHYFAPHGILSCSATPIFDPWGQCLGVLDISGDARQPQLHALALARQAVAQIEHRYFEQRYAERALADCELLRLHHQPALLGSAREGVLGFRAGRLVAANRAGLALFGLERHDLGRTPYEALFEQPLSRLANDGVLLDRQGRTLHGVRQMRSAAVAVSAPPARPTAGAATATGPRGGPLFDDAASQQLQRASRVLQAGLPVLLQGETGTGKEVFARELHARSARAGRPFMAVNCAALPEGLIEAELFGYEEGAFTGARRQGSAGLLRQAEGGVLFLDEIGDMPLALQPRLLRVLQERELSPLGGGKPVKLDFALVCASHCALPQAVADGRFRADLYYRIADHVVELPPLRAHPDRPALVDALWQQLGQGHALPAATRAALAACPWPGNLRQLSACLRTLVALAEPGQALTPDLLPAHVRAGGTAAAPLATVPSAAASGALEDITEAAMRQALAASEGNVTAAARRLGISRSTLYRRLGKPQPR